MLNTGFINEYTKLRIGEGAIQYSNLSLYSLFYIKVCKELAEPISMSLREGNTAPFEMSQRWRAVDNTVSDLTVQRFEPRTYRSSDKHVTAQSTGYSVLQ